MNVYSGGDRDDKDQSLSNKNPDKKLSTGAASLQFADNRAETIIQGKLQEGVHNSPQDGRLAAMQQMANTQLPLVR